MSKKCISVLTALTVLLCSMLTVHAGDHLERNITRDMLSMENITYFENQGIDCDSIVRITLEEVSYNSSDESKDTAQVLIIDTRDGDQIQSHAIFLTDENGTPVSNLRLSSYSNTITSYKHNNTIQATITYNIYGDILSGVFVNPCCVSIRASYACTNVSVIYGAQGPLYNVNTTPATKINNYTNAQITNSYTSIAPNTNYPTYGIYNLFALPLGQAVYVGNSDLGSGTAHGVTVGYTYNGNSYYVPLSFPVYT